MDDIFHALAAHRGGYLFRHDLIDAGFRDADIFAACRAGHLTRLRHGTYAPSSLLAPLSPEERHLLLARSVLDKLGPGVVLSHHSAAIAHCGESFGVDLAVVHVTQLSGRHGRREAGVDFHVGRLDDDEIVEVDGMLAVGPARAAYESACLSSVEAGMVTMSSILHAGACTPEELADVGARFERWAGGRGARLAIRLADGRCESVGESRSLYMFWREGVPRPDVQVCVRLQDGRVVARTDFGWLACRHTGEFDGLFKYGRLNPFVEPGRVLTKEKQREDLVRGVEVGMSRWTWPELDPPQRSATALRIREGLAQSRRLYTRNATYFPLFVA